MGAFYSHLVFRPPVPAGYSENDFPLTQLTTKNNYRFPCTFIERKDAYFTILFSHGNGEDLGNAMSYLQQLCSTLKVNGVTYDYTGYGLASGKPSEEACYANVEAVYEYLVNVKKIVPDRIIVFGRSLGSAPSIHIACLRPVRGLILVSPLSSCIRVVRPRLHVTLPFDMFVNIHKISLVYCPVLIIHGCQDRVVPFSNAIDLYKRCRRAVNPLWIADGGHNNLELFHRDEMLEKYRQFLEYVLHNPVWNEKRRNRFSYWFKHWKRKKNLKDSSAPGQYPFEDTNVEEDENWETNMVEGVETSIRDWEHSLRAPVNIQTDSRTI
eukprot:jgi/Galph1/3352/GphlegSOOS_G2053.1